MRRKIPGISLLFFLIPAAFAQAPGGPSALPLDILRPQYGEEARFPRDYVIGKLGRGDAAEESYQAAKRIMAGLVSGNAAQALADLPRGKRALVLDSIRALGPRAWRIGGGRNEPDGSVSFLIRFLGREQSITGELYLRYTVPEEPPAGAAESPAGETRGPAENTEAAAENTAEVPGNGETAADDVAETVNGENPAGIPAVPEDPESPAENPAIAGTAAGNGGAAAANAPRAAGSPAIRWRVEDLLLEPPGGLTEGQFGPAGADMTPYERFF
ncbi:MAG: hypothetical protein LBC31_06825 [Treponema sp.]|nr:hypothetical protein [Treponema sp.]